jgi:uncharacterized protein DUF4190
MTNPIPTGDHTPGYTSGAYPGGAEPASYTPYTPYGEQPPQQGGETTPAYGAPPPPPQYAPYPPQYQPYQGQYQPGAAPPYPGYPQQYVPGMNPTNALAIASFVCSLVGIVVGGLGIVGIILGHIALGQIKRSNGYERGHGYAVAGLIIGYAELAIGLIAAIIFLSLILIVPSTIPTN